MIITMIIMIITMIIMIIIIDTTMCISQGGIFIGSSLSQIDQIQRD